MTADTPTDTDEQSTGERAGDDQPPAEPPDSDEIGRRRLIRWIAVLAFGVPVVIELYTFRAIIVNELFPNENAATPTESATPTDHPDAVGVGDELLSETAAAETIQVSEVRQDEDGERTYVLRVVVENGTAEPVELRMQTLHLRGGTAVDGVSSTGTIDAGTESKVTGAWRLPNDSMPSAVECVAVRNGETVFDGFVNLKRPPIRG